MSYKLAEALYKTAGAGAEGAATNGASSNGVHDDAPHAEHNEDVIDAEFKEAK